MKKRLKRTILKLVLGNKLREIDQLYYDKFCHNLKNNIPFSFARYGDGEWAAILNFEGRNTDGHQYFSDLGISLKTAISKPVEYYLGIQPFALRKMMPEISPILLEHNNHFLNADILHNASEIGIITSFFNALQTRRIILVGPAHLTDQHVIAIADHVVIPDENCWLDRENTLSQVKETLGDKEDIVIFCASMAGNVYIDNLFEEFGQFHSFLDLGSLLDPFAGKMSRGYHKRVNTSLPQQ